MDIVYILVAAAILVLPTLLSRLFSGSGDTKVVLGAPPARARGPKQVQAAALRERVHALVKQRRYSDAVKLVQTASGVSLGKAQKIVATIQKAEAARAGRRTGAAAR